jgi:hypothetical protein
MNTLILALAFLCFNDGPRLWSPESQLETTIKFTIPEDTSSTTVKIDDDLWVAMYYGPKNTRRVISEKTKCKLTLRRNGSTYAGNVSINTPEKTSTLFLTSEKGTAFSITFYAGEWSLEKNILRPTTNSRKTQEDDILKVFNYLSDGKVEEF